MNKKAKWHYLRSVLLTSDLYGGIVNSIEKSEYEESEIIFALMLTAILILHTCRREGEEETLEQHAERAFKAAMQSYHVDVFPMAEIAKIRMIN